MIERAGCGFGKTAFSLALLLAALVAGAQQVRGQEAIPAVPEQQSFQIAARPENTINAGRRSQGWSGPANNGRMQQALAPVEARNQQAPVNNGRMQQTPAPVEARNQQAPAGNRSQQARPTPTPTPAAVVKNVAKPAAPVLHPTYYDKSPLPASGLAMYYNPGIMNRVLDYRMSVKQVTPCDECVGYVALLRKGDLNRKVWIEWHDGALEGPYLVIDVAGRSVIGNLLARGWIVDVDNESARRHKMNGPVQVTVMDQTAMEQSILAARGLTFAP